MRQNTLLVDAGIAVLVAVLLIVLSPGLAVVGLIALLVVLVCAISFGIDRRHKRRPKNPADELRRSRAAEARASRRGPGTADGRRSSVPRGRSPRR